MNLKERSALPNKVVVVGMGTSGRAVCELLLQQGAQITATDLRTRGDFNGALDHLEAKGCLLRLGVHNVEDFLSADQIIVLEEGRVVGRGTHRQLMTDCQVYREIALSQLGQEALA